MRSGHGAENTSIVCHFVINLVRSANDIESIETRRKLAGMKPGYLRPSSPDRDIEPEFSAYRINAASEDHCQPFETCHKNNLAS